MIKHIWLCGLAMTMAGTVAARTPIDLSALDRGLSAPRTQVLVLGTVHLAGAPKGFDASSLDPVLDKLAAFKPQIITVEQIPGEACDFTARYPTVYPPEDMQPYCSDSAAAKAATGLDVPAAVAEVNRTLKAWPAKPASSQRRRLAALFLAANDTASALVQWLYLPKAERHAGDGIDDALIQRLDKRAASNNETDRIAVRLAVRLGLQRVFAVDDHTGDNVDVADAAAYGNAIQAAWNSASAKMQPVRERESALWKAGDMLAMYRFVNDPQTLRTAIESDFGAALRDPSPQHYGRIYVAGWETRNLRMAANVHATFRERPGVRVLSIVGSSHKPWFDSLLGQMQGVEIVDAEKVLK